jgi:hypothetical protein
MRVTEIFTPSDYPLYTYVARDEERIEDRLREALMTPGEIVSVSGPSKSGKTVLIEKVAGRDNLITITGAGLSDASQVWDRALDWMGSPSQTSETTTSTISASVTATAKGGLTLPLVGSIRAEGGGGVSGARASGATETRSRTGLPQVVREIGNSSFVLLIDDFHYMPGLVQAEVAKQIKEAARQGVKIVTASVPHRSDDVVRSNPELRGRVRTVDTKPWKVAELLRIAELGFPAAGLRLPENTMREFAVESSQSPQLMQAICLQVCFTLKQYEAKPPIVDRQLSPVEIRTAYEETSTRTDFASLIRSMHAGPKIRGTERKEFDLTDGSRGDVYRSLLLALRADPPTLGFQWNEISRRVQATCRPDSPQAASLSTACAQIAKIAKEMYPNQRVVDWEDAPVNLLSIEDPYFLFYLRWSDKLAGLQREAAA